MSINSRFDNLLDTIFTVTSTSHFHQKNLFYASFTPQKIVLTA